MVDSIGLRIELPMEIVMGKMREGIRLVSKDGTKSTLTTECWHISQRNKITFIVLSLPKFIQGNNLYDLSFAKLMRAVKLVIEMLNIPPEEILLYRVDISFNIIFKRPTSYYISQFNQIEKYLMSTYDNERSCMYKNKDTSLLFYDKLYKEFGERIPEKFKKYKNRVMRIEVQRKKKIKDIFNYQNGNITILALLDKNFLEFFLKHWFDYYTLVINSRSKLIPLLPTTELVKTASQLQRHLASIGLSTCKVNNIKSFKDNEIKLSWVKNDMKKKILELQEYGYLAKTNKQDDDFTLFEEKIRKIYQKKLEELKNI